LPCRPDAGSREVKGIDVIDGMDLKIREIFSSFGTGGIARAKTLLAVRSSEPKGRGSRVSALDFTG